MCGPYYVGDGDRHQPNHANMMAEVVKGGFKIIGDCTDVNSAYLAPVRAEEKRIGLAP